MLSLFDKLRIKHRLLLLMVIPLCGFIAMSFKGTMEKRVVAQEAARLGELTRVSVKIGALAHEMQKERGMTSGFIGSKGAKFVSELPAQRLETDKRTKEFMDTLAGFDTSHYAATLKALVAEAQEGLNPLGDQRKAAGALAIPAGESIGYYTQTIGKLLKIPAQVPSLSTNSDISRLSSGYANLLYAKERAGIERATLANVFGVGKFSVDMLQRFIANASAQEVYTNQFLTFATESQAAFYKSKVSGASVEEVARLKKWAQDNATEPLNVDATFWFKVATDRINLLKEVEDRLSADLISTADEIRQDGERIVLAYTFLALASLLVTFILAYMIVRSIARQLGGEPLYAMQVAQRVAEGNLSVAVETSPGDTASLVASMKTMQEQLLARITADKKISDENARIRIALGNVSANVMIADNDNNIIYLNPAVQRMLKNAEADLRRHLPDFDASRLEGANMDAFHKNPAHQRDLLATLTTTYRSQIEIAGRTFYLVANPVVNDVGERIGSVVEWSDRTNEVYIEKEVNQIVQSAQQGVLTERLNLAGKEGFMKQLSGGINQLLDTVSGALNNLERVLAALALGDLTQKINEDYQGTFGQLKNSANATVENLTQLVGDIKIAVESINTGAKEIAMGNVDLSQRTEAQAASLEETASSMEELTSTVKANSDNAHQANQYAIGASDVAGKGGAVVSQVVGTMSSINDSSRKIVDIISVIDGIAFQTNILALNAAVEAARAGEQGRGFAVVAAEVRNLAQRSAAAAKEIKILIGDSVDKVENGSRLVKQAGQTMEDIVTSIKRVTGIMAEISSASVEQSSGIEQVNKAITQMDEVTQQNAALVEQAAAAAESLEEQAQNLFASVAVFKLESGTGLAMR